MASTIGQLLLATADRSPDRRAFRTSTRSLSYSNLSDAADRVAEGVRLAGAAGERVALLLPNASIFVAGLHGIFRSGGSALLLNPSSSAREIDEQVGDTGSRWAVTDARLGAGLPSWMGRILVGEEGETEIEPPTGSRPAAFGAIPATRFDDEAVVIFTAAMKGRARGASLSHRNLLTNVRSAIAAMELSPTDRVVAALPFAHAFGLTICLNAPTTIGATILPVARFNARTVLEILESEGATVLAGVPAMFIAVISEFERGGSIAHSLRLSVCGGAPMPLEVGRRWEELFGIPLRQGYGLTEASPVCLFNRLDRPNRLGTLGSPLPGVEASIRDARGGILPEGEVGELCVRGDNVFSGYLDAAREAAPFHGDWFRTGDLASRSGDVFRFRGTLKPMFTRSGFNVYPEEIRRVLLQDSRIADVLVCGRSESSRENEIVLVVQAKAGKELTEEDVRARCRTSFAAYKQPSRIRIERRS